MTKDDKALQDLTYKLNLLQMIQKEKRTNLITKYSGELKKGDLIIVSGNNSSYLAFYLGRGQGGSMQHYGLDQLCAWFDNKNDPNCNSKKGGPYKYYINSPHPNRVSKYSENLLNDEFFNRYEKAREALKLLNI